MNNVSKQENDYWNNYHSNQRDKQLDELEKEVDRLQKLVDENALLHSVINCPFCNSEMKGIKLTHYKCKKCDEYFTD